MRRETEPFAGSPAAIRDDTPYQPDPPSTLLDVDPIEEGLVGPRDTGRCPPEELAPPRGAGLTHDDRFRSGRLAGLGMAGAIWVLSWPVMVESLLNSLVGITDTWLASQLGEPQADAIGGAAYITWFLGLAFMAVGVGATAMISRAMGRGRLAAASATMSQSTLVAAVLGVVVGLVVTALTPLLSRALNLSGPSFTSYLTILALGSPISSVLFVLIACARGAGDSVRPLWAMLARNIVNVVASVALSGVDIAVAREVDGAIHRTVIFDNPLGAGLGIPGFTGIMGIAAGTILADLAGLVIVLRMGVSGTWGIRLLARRMRPHAATLWRLIRLGIPNFLETLGMWLGNFAVVMMVGWMGAGLLGAHIVAIRLESLSFLPGFAVGTAAATLAGQYLGAGRPDLARRSMMWCTLLACAAMGLCGLAFLTIPGQLVGLMSSQPAHLSTTPKLMFLAGLVQVPFAVSLVLRGAMRGAGDVRMVMWLTWISTYAIRLPLAYLLSGVDIPLPGGVTIHNPMPDDFPLSGLVGLWAALCGDLVIRGILFAARFLHGGWATARV